MRIGTVHTAPYPASADVSADKTGHQHTAVKHPANSYTLPDARASAHPGQGPAASTRQSRSGEEPRHAGVIKARGAPRNIATILYGGCAGSKDSYTQAPAQTAAARASARRNGEYSLDVPYVSQAGDPAGCWYACAQMVGYRAESGPRLALPNHYNSETSQMQGLGGRDIEQLIENENLRKVALPRSREFSCADIEELLMRRGPIIFGGVPASGEGLRHMCVLTGVSTARQTITYHDPAKGPSREMPLSKLNARLAWDTPNAMLQHNR